MKEKTRNVKVTVENSANGFHIYLDFSGQREYVMTHRRSGLLYLLLKNGADLEDLRRWRYRDLAARVGKASQSVCAKKLTGMVQHLLLVIDDYLMDRAC